MTLRPIDRRQIIAAGGAILLSETGLIGPLSQRFGRRLAAFGEARADGSGLAPVTNPVLDVLYSAKLDCEYLARNTMAVGCIGNPGLVPSSVYPEVGVLKHFGDRLAPLEQSVSLCLIACDKGSPNGGNHDFAAQVHEVADVGWLAPYLMDTYGGLLPLDFAVTATAFQANAIVARGGVVLPSYPTIAAAVLGLNAQIQSLGVLPATAAVAQSQFDRLIAGTTGLAARMAAVAAAVKPLPSALAAAVASIPAPTLPASTNRAVAFLDDSLMWDNNPLRCQFQIADLLWQAGLNNAATFALGHADVNAGGDYAHPGGANTNGIALSALESHVMISQLALRFFTKYPAGVMLVRGDGCRSQIGSDNDTGPAILMASRSALQCGFPAGDAYKTVDGYGTAQPQLLSDGRTTSVPTQANVAATAAVLAGYTYGSHAYVKGVVLKS